MPNRYMLVGLAHLVTVALVLKILQYVLPCFLTCYYSCAANLVMCVIVAKLTFGFSKKKFLADRIQTDNRAVFITGCDSGFGHGLAKQLDSRQFHVFASCLFPSGPGADDLRKSCSKRLLILELDVSKDDSVKAALDFVKENLGTSELWAIVNNAGITKGYSVELTSLQHFRDTLEINTFGVVRVTKAFLPLLRQSRGRVVNIASLAGRIPIPHSTPYTMSKSATVAFSECLRQEINVWGVKVISVEPEFFQQTNPKTMPNRYMLVGLAHLVTVALVLKILQYVLPCCLTCYYSCAANLVMCVFVAKLTFGFSKKKFLADRIQTDNRAVFITGCDSGFGHGLAKQLDSRGFHVFASCLFPSGEGADDLRKSCSKRLQILELDVSKDDSVKAALEFVKENLGTSELWAIVNNAGIVKGYSVELTSLQHFRDTLEVNTFGVVRVTKAFLPLLRQSRGRVVNIASLAGRIPLAHCTPYTMSKYATVAFSECLRQEMDVWGVKVISVEPEFFQTNMTKSENVGKSMEDTFADIDEDIKADYGDKYLKDFKANFEFGVKNSSEKVSKVLKALELAISLEDPDVVYRPCRHIGTRVFWKTLEIMPKVLQDFCVTKLYRYATGFPKPKEAANS